MIKQADTMQQVSHRKSATLDTLNEIWANNDAEDITNSYLHLDHSDSSYFLTFKIDSLSDLEEVCSEDCELRNVFKLKAKLTFNACPVLLLHSSSTIMNMT